MVRLGIALASAVFKPATSSASMLVIVHQRPRISNLFKGTAVNLTLTGRRNYSSSNSNNSSVNESSVAAGHASGTEIGSTKVIKMFASATSSSASMSTSSSSCSKSSTFPATSSFDTSPAKTKDVKCGKVDGESSVVGCQREDVVTTFEAGDPEQYFELSQSFVRSEKWKCKLVSSMLVYPNFISQEEEASILKEIEPYISRLHYENSHWDDAIHEYRETERSKWNKKNEKIINRIRELAFPPGVPQLKLVHILDLAKKGVIKPHIDSIRFCGNTIAGLSLLSSCVMRLRHDVQTDFYCDVHLPRLSLYVMKEFSRYEFTHEILGENESQFKNEEVKRDRRISVICRNEPDNTPGPVFKPLV